MGVLQLVNKQNEEPFNVNDEKCILAIGQSLALALYNQQKQSKTKPTKFSYLINNGLLSQEELTQAITHTRTQGIDIEAILLGELKIKQMITENLWRSSIKLPMSASMTRLSCRNLFLPA